ncbi:ABC transporter ATP-binding protein [Thermotoga profunda]|uniref:ABC transporter ATP-binding protein n=1 Tax=Thermotoga profunda TaxID=1508420 RepID=UPI00069381FD
MYFGSVVYSFGGEAVKIVEVNDLRKSYGNFKALKGISFEIEEGEIFGLIGPNGAGKTTTLRIICTLLKPDAGVVKVFGHDLSSEPHEVRKVISYLPEDAGAYKELTGLEYLKFIAKFFAKNESHFQQIVERGTQISGLSERLKTKVSTYSKGMTRRLLIARALMVDPKLAVLDEPTSGLDVLNAREVRNTIKEFVKNGGTVLLSSHNMLEVEFLCDRIALINNGQIVKTGTPKNLKEEFGVSNVEEVFTEVIRCSGTC